MTDWVTSVIEAAGYLGLALMMALECVFPPIPSEAILPFVGFAVAEGDISFPLALAAATGGALAGNVASRPGALSGRPLPGAHDDRRAIAAATRDELGRLRLSLNGDCARRSRRPGPPAARRSPGRGTTGAGR